MATTITAYQVLRDGPLTIADDGTQLGWDPSNDMRRDGSLDNHCILQFNVNPRGSGGQLRVHLNGQDVVEPGGIPVRGRDRGMFLTFPSNVANLANNTFTFFHETGDDNEPVVLEEVAVFYKRRIEEV